MRGGIMANSSSSHLHNVQEQGIGRPPARDLSPEPRMGRSGCCTGFLCLGSLKRGKRIVPANRIHDGSNGSPRPWGNNGGAPQPGPSNMYATLSPSLLAPPSSPASFQNSAVQSSAQSPCSFPVMSSNPSATSQIPLESAQTMFQMGPYAHETALVSPPVFSTFTTAPSTAPFTPPPELATHVTTPSSPEVPFAQLLANSFGTKAVARSQPQPAFPASSFTSPDIFSADDLQAAYQLYPGSPLAHLISPTSGTGASTPFPESEMSTQLTPFQEPENSPPPATVASMFILGSPMTTTTSDAASPISHSMRLEVELVKTPSQASSGAITPVRSAPPEACSSEALAFSLQSQIKILDFGSSKALNSDVAQEQQEQEQEQGYGHGHEHRHGVPRHGENQQHHEKSPLATVTATTHTLECGQINCGSKVPAGHANVEREEQQMGGEKSNSSSMLDDGRQEQKTQANFATNHDNSGGKLFTDEASNSEATALDDCAKKGLPLPVQDFGVSGSALSDGGSIPSTVQIQQQQGMVESSKQVNGTATTNQRNNNSWAAHNYPNAAIPSTRRSTSTSSSPRVENAVVLELGPEAVIKNDIRVPHQCNNTGALDVTISDLVAWEHLKGKTLPAKLSISKVSLLDSIGTGSAIHSRTSSKDSVSTVPGGSSLSMTRLSDGGAACSDLVRLQHVTVAATTTDGYFDGPSPSPQFNFTTQKFETTGHMCGEEHGKDCAGRAKLENKCVLKVLLEHAMEKPAGVVVKDRVGIYREQQLNASLKWMQAGTALHQRSMVESGPRERADLGATCAGSHSGSSTPPLGITLVEELK